MYFVLYSRTFEHLRMIECTFVLFRDTWSQQGHPVSCMTTFSLCLQISLLCTRPQNGLSTWFLNSGDLIKYLNYDRQGGNGSDHSRLVCAWYHMYGLHQTLNSKWELGKIVHFCICLSEIL